MSAPAPKVMADDAAHLLIVDDDRRIRDLLSRFLAEQGDASAELLFDCDHGV